MKNLSYVTVILLLISNLGFAGQTAASERLLVTLAAEQQLLILNSDGQLHHRIKIGIAPWSIAVHEHLAYVTTAEGLAVVDLNTSKRVALVPYPNHTGKPTYGEYRPGGMGLAVSPDGQFVYTAVYNGSSSSRMEVFDVQRGNFTQGFNVGTRPFDVQVSPDGKTVVSIDHDSYSVTAIDTQTGRLKRHDAAPLGYAAFDKPHYAKFNAEGRLYLPIQGKILAELDLTNGVLKKHPLSADTHQHGVSWRPQSFDLVIVGTGPAGDANSGPSLTLFDINTKKERIIPLRQEHEQVVVTGDGRYAWLTGGQSFTGGWNGLTQVDLITGQTRSVPVEGQPFGIALTR